MGNICSLNTPEKPEIVSEIDQPFPATPQQSQSNKDVLTQIQLNDQKHTHAVEDLKNAVGKTLLYGCLIAVVVLAFVDAFTSIDSPMFTSVFELLKVVSTTVLGYMFGSKARS